MTGPARLSARSGVARSGATRSGAIIPAQDTNKTGWKKVTPTTSGSWSPA